MPLFRFAWKITSLTKRYLLKFSDEQNFYILQERERRTDGGTDKRTDIRTNKGEVGSHFTCQHITCDLSVQCNAMQNSSIVWLRTAVGWFTKKKQGRYLKKKTSHALEQTVYLRS